MGMILVQVFNQFIKFATNSTYEEVHIYANDSRNTRHYLVSFHPAILSADSGQRVLASCVTFSPPNKVPPGSSQRVKANMLSSP